MSSRRTVLGCASFAAALVSSAFAHAQPALPTKPAAPASTPPAPEEAADASPAKTASPDRASDPPDVLETGPSAAPPPGPPQRDSQSPRPYELFPDRPRERKVELGPEFVVWHRGSDDDSVTYTTDVAVGANARIELREWLGLRLFFLSGQQGVSVERGGLVANGDVDHPDLSVIQLGARLEPTWVVTPRLRLWAGLSAAWARAEASRPNITTSAGAAWTTERAGVFVELGGGLGVTFDVIPHWLAVWVGGSAATVLHESGDLFQQQQAIGKDSSLFDIDGLPKMSTALAGTLGVSLIL